MDALIRNSTTAVDNPSMSSVNLNLVRSIYTAWERGDYRHLEWAHPEMEYSSRRRALARYMDGRRRDDRGLP